MGVSLKFGLIVSLLAVVVQGRFNNNNNNNELRGGWGSGRNSNGCENSCICSQENRPFCGTDGITYSNNCRLECARTNCNKRDLRVKFEGVCPVPYNSIEGGNSRYSKPELPKRKPIYTTTRPLRVYDRLTSRPQQPDPNCITCPCTYDYSPICGSDGRTYSNRCQFNCARTKCNSGLYVANDDQCSTFG